MTAEALYVGGGKERTFKNGNICINIELNLTDLEAKMAGHVNTWRSRKGGGTEQKTIKLILAPLKNPDERRTHSLRIDTWKPDKPKGNDNGAYKRVKDHFAPHDLPVGDALEDVPF